MSKFFASLLDIPEPIASAFCQKMEALSGYPSEDMRWQSEIEQSAKNKVSQLGLDPLDTTNHELYHALLTRLRSDNIKFAASIGDVLTDQPDVRLNRLVNLIKQADIPKTVWALKPTVAKDLLRARPPRQLMKVLNYRSIDSLLKRAQLSEVYAALPYCESSTWLTAFWHAQEKLTGNDFENQPLKIMVMPTKRWQPLLNKVPLVSRAPQTGTVAVWPTPTATKTGGFNLCLVIVEEIEALTAQNSALKLQQVRPRFGPLAVRSWTDSESGAAQIAGQPISWRSLQRHYAKLPLLEHPMTFEPHIEAQDFRWQNSHNILANLSPLFGWWSANHHLAFGHHEKLTSLNLADVISGQMSARSYHKHTSTAAGQAAWDELISRYLKHPGVENYILSQLDKALTATETINMSTPNAGLPTLKSLALEAQAA